MIVSTLRFVGLSCLSWKWRKRSSVKITERTYEKATAAFQQRGRTNHQPEQERIAYLEQKIQTKDEVLAELMAEHVALKKRVGEL
jgi:Rad3-related DNA helicase